jgi:ribosomal protein L23
MENKILLINKNLILFFFSKDSKKKKIPSQMKKLNMYSVDESNVNLLVMNVGKRKQNGKKRLL